MDQVMDCAKQATAQKLHLHVSVTRVVAVTTRLCLTGKGLYTV